MIVAAKAYLIFNILCLVSLLVLTLTEGFSRNATCSARLKLAYLLTAAMIVIPVLSVSVAPVDFMPLTSQVFSADSMRNPSAAFSDPARVAVALTPHREALAAHSPAMLLVTLLAAGMLASIVHTIWSFLRLRRLLKASTPVRRIKTVRIVVSDHISIPFSFWQPFRTFIAIPSTLIINPEHFRLAVAHEIQHHRQHDTFWLHVLSALKAIAFWNPFFHLLDRKITHLQEFACDEALAGQRGLSSLAYCRCLLWVAEKSLHPARRFAGTAGMTSGAAGKVLKRRIELMMISRKETLRKKSLAAAGAAALFVMSGIGLAANSSIQDRRVTLGDALQMADSANRDGSFPVVINDMVLAQLNRYLGTPDGREYFRRSLARMEDHRAVVEARIESFGLPAELMAVPIVESGYRNLRQSANPANGAGIWMFIAQTARHYGLKVNTVTDERLDVEKETEAAMRLLSSLHLRYQDWGLALLGYNAGAGLVSKAIGETGSRDVWYLVRNGYENDPDYVAKVMAAVLILKNPASLD